MPLTSRFKSRNLTLGFIRSLLSVLCFGIPVIFIDTDVLQAQESQLIAEFNAYVIIHQVAWSPDGELIAAATDNGTLILNQNLTLIATLHGHSGNASYAVAWSPDGLQLATGGDGDKDGLIVWDRDKTTNDFNVNRALSASNGNVRALDWSPDGQNLAVMNEVVGTYAIHAVIDIWDITGTWRRLPIPNYFYEEANYELAWSFNSQFLALGNRFSCTPATIVGTCKYAGQDGILLFDVVARDIVRVIATLDSPLHVHWSPVNMQIANVENPEIEIYDGITGERIRRDLRFLWDFDWSSDGQQIAGLSSDEVFILDAISGEVILHISLEGAHFTLWDSLANQFVVASDTGLIQVWQLGSSVNETGE